MKAGTGTIGQACQGVQRLTLKDGVDMPEGAEVSVKRWERHYGAGTLGGAEVRI